MGDYDYYPYSIEEIRDILAQPHRAPYGDGFWETSGYHIARSLLAYIDDIDPKED